MSQPVGTRWFREAGGMAPISLVALSKRFLSFGEREELALLNAQCLGVREIARRMERSPSTISRELRRNAETRGGVLRYRATVAQWKRRDQPGLYQALYVQGRGALRRELSAWHGAVGSFRGTLTDQHL